jgi:hypothetical protein
LATSSTKYLPRFTSPPAFVFEFDCEVDCEFGCEVDRIAAPAVTPIAATTRIAIHRNADGVVFIGSRLSLMELHFEIDFTSTELSIQHRRRVPAVISSQLIRNSIPSLPDSFSATPSLIHDGMAPVRARRKPFGHLAPAIL